MCEVSLMFRVPFSLFCQSMYMDGFKLEKHSAQKSFLQRRRLRRSLRHWQQVRSWARLIREAENLWQVDSKELKRLGAIELIHLLEEVPPSYRRRVNLWLDNYSVATRF